jgi:hypothetical protein
MQLVFGTVWCRSLKTRPNLCALAQALLNFWIFFYLHLQDVGNRVTLWTIMSPLHFYLHLQDVGNL